MNRNSENHLHILGDDRTQVSVKRVAETIKNSHAWWYIKMKPLIPRGPGHAAICRAQGNNYYWYDVSGHWVFDPEYKTHAQEIFSKENGMEGAIVHTMVNVDKLPSKYTDEGNQLTNKCWAFCQQVSAHLQGRTRQAGDIKRCIYKSTKGRKTFVVR